MIRLLAVPLVGLGLLLSLGNVGPGISRFVGGQSGTVAKRATVRRARRARGIPCQIARMP